MAVEKITAVLRYKRHNGADYFLVRWADGSTAWNRLGNIAEKDFVCAFVARALGILKAKHAAELQQSQKQMEEDMLKRIIDQNKDTAPRAEPLEARIASSPPETERQEKKAAHPCETALKRPYPEIMPGRAEAGAYMHKMPRMDAKAARGPYDAHAAVCADVSRKVLPNRAHRDPSKTSIFSLKLGGRQLFQFDFYGRGADPHVSLAVEDMAFVPRWQIETHLHNLHMAQHPRFELFCSDNFSVGSFAEYNVFKWRMVNSSLIPVALVGDTCWVLLFAYGGTNALRLPVHKRYILLKITGDKLLQHVWRLKNSRAKDAGWACRSYGASASLFGDFVYEADLGRLKGPVHYVGDRTSCAGQYLARALRGYASLSTTPTECCSVVVQESFFDYMHQIRGIARLRAAHTTFYGVAGFRIFEVLKAGCVFAFTDAFVASCDMPSLLDFLAALQTRKNWGVQITDTAYRLLKSRFIAVQAQLQDPSSLKAPYNMLKSGRIEGSVGDIGEYIEKAGWHQHRRFFVIDEVYGSGSSISFDEARRLTSS
ncbi:hypothetical protein PAPHI01_1521 [Pancytospora philotis]|nr:hypothetical protein PAPHI01_1521 [Pancytospora philotis]